MITKWLFTPSYFFSKHKNSKQPPSTHSMSKIKVKICATKFLSFYKTLSQSQFMLRHAKTWVEKHWEISYAAPSRSPKKL